MVVAIPPRNRSWEHVAGDENSHPSSDGLGGRHRAPTLHALCSPGFPVVAGVMPWLRNRRGIGSTKASGQVNYALPLNPTRRLLFPRSEFLPRALCAAAIFFLRAAADIVRFGFGA